MKTIQITDKQLEILILLYRFRFLNRHHIQKMLHHKKHSLINSWLKDLTDKHIIGRIYSEKLKDNTAPAIYHLHTKAISILKEQDTIDTTVLKKAYRDRTRSEKLREHCLLIADIYLKFEQSTDQANSKLEFYTRSQLTPQEYILKPAPDAYIGIVGKENTHRYFLEVIDSHVPRFAIKHRIKQYFEYYDEQTWQDTTQKPFPAIMIVCADEKISSVTKLLENLITESDTNLCIYITVSSQLKSPTSITSIWQQIIAQ